MISKGWRISSIVINEIEAKAYSRTEENLLLIRHFRNERVTGTEMRPQLFLGLFLGRAGQSLVTVPDVFAKKTRSSFLLVSKVAHVMCGRKKKEPSQYGNKAV